MRNYVINCVTEWFVKIWITRTRLNSFGFYLIRQNPFYILPKIQFPNGLYQHLLLWLYGVLPLVWLYRLFLLVLEFCLYQIRRFPAVFVFIFQIFLENLVPFLPFPSLWDSS